MAQIHRQRQSSALADTAKVITAWTPLLDSLAKRVADLENDRAARYRLLDEAF